MFGFGKKKEKETKNTDGFLIPISGKIIELSEVQDPVFSQKLMGDGFAIEPASGEIYAPISGEIISLFPHAVGIKGDSGMEVLVHFGLDTVKLEGEGFTLHKKSGDKVNAGDLIITVDVDAVKGKVPAITTPVIFTDPAGKTFSINQTEVNAKDADAVTVK